MNDIPNHYTKSTTYKATVENGKLVFKNPDNNATFGIDGVRDKQVTRFKRGGGWFIQFLYNAEIWRATALKCSHGDEIYTGHVGAVKAIASANRPSYTELHKNHSNYKKDAIAAIHTALKAIENEELVTGV